jgi:hypothetical protein
MLQRLVAVEAHSAKNSFHNYFSIHYHSASPYLNFIVSHPPLHLLLGLVNSTWARITSCANLDFNATLS